MQTVLLDLICTTFLSITTSFTSNTDIPLLLVRMKEASRGPSKDCSVVFFFFDLQKMCSPLRQGICNFLEGKSEDEKSHASFPDLKGKKRKSLVGPLPHTVSMGSSHTEVFAVCCCVEWIREFAQLWFRHWDSWDKCRQLPLRVQPMWF